MKLTNIPVLPAMQWIDIDMFMGNPLKTNPKKGQPIPGSSVGKGPILRMYGVNEKGNSAVVNVHGFTPYFYCKAPPYVCYWDTRAFTLVNPTPFTHHGYLAGVFRKSIPASSARG